MHHLIADGIHGAKALTFDRFLSTCDIQSELFSKVFAHLYIFVFLMRILCTHALEVDTIHYHVNMRMLLIVMTKCNKLVIIISHSLQIIIDQLSQYGVVNAWCIMWRKGKDEVSNRFLCSAAQSSMHHETIRYGLIVRQVDAITCCYQCGILSWIVDIVDETTKRRAMKYFTVHIEFDLTFNH